MKNICYLFGWFLTVGVCAPAFAISATDLRYWQGVAPKVLVEDAGDGFSRLACVEDICLPPVDAVGRPALPCRTVLFAVPDRAEVASVSSDATWETLAEGVKVVPVAEPVLVGESAQPAAPDPAVYGGTAVCPARAVVTGRVERTCGVRVLPVTVTPFRWHPDTGLLERAAQLSVRVTFATGAERSYVLAPGLLEGVRMAVANPEDVTLEPGGTRSVASVARLARPRQSAALPVTETADYLLLSPPDFVDDWEWYVRARKSVHTNVTFKVKNTAEIYAAYPFPSATVRNAAESIHAYLRDARATMKFTYVVLGGAWLDAQERKKTAPRFYGGELMSLSNCVPGVYGFPREDWREIPSDMFYACLDIKPGQAHAFPWDANGDGVYIDQADCPNNDLMPDVVVARITLNPYRPNGLPPYNRHELVTNYVAKLARGEAKGFAGHYRYGVSPDSTGSRRRRATGDRMHYKELSFYDNMYNLFDPRHSEWIEDNEYAACGRLRYQFSCWRPVLETKGMMNNTWTLGQPTLAAALNDYYASDRDYGFVYSHGWAQGATHFQAGRFATAKGLTLLNGSNGPCDTGYVDYHVTMNGVLTLQYNLGDSGVSNPEGGALCSINNTRWGWAGGSNGWDESMSYLMLNRSLIGFNQLGLDAGQAWLKGVRDYAGMGGPQNGGTSTWTLTEQILYGDPLVRLPDVPNVWWTGGSAGGVWDGTTSCWSNSVDTAREYGPASNVYFNVTEDFTLDIATNVAALRLSLPVRETNATVMLAGAGSLRVMTAIDVAGTNTELKLNVRGGVGHDGVRFLTGKGTLTFEGTNEFYLARVQNAAALKLDGAGVTVDVDEFPANETVPLSVTGPGGTARPEPNVLRSSVAGGLRRFGDFGITNGYVRLSTVDAFGNDKNKPATIRLTDAHLDIGANVYYERYTCMEGLNATFEVDGKARLSSSEGGLFTVKHVTTFNLKPNAKLTLAAHTVDGGGRIVINGDGETTLEVPLADALAGDVVVNAGVRLVLDALPLENVKSLKLEEGAELVLPHAVSGYWQLLPLSATLDCPAGVAIYDASDLAHPLEGTSSATGSFFRKGALYTWDRAEGDWDASVAAEADKIVFADVTGGLAAVHVRQAVAPSFAYFANAATRYAFDAPSGGATVTFNGVILSGETDFALPVFAREYVSLTGGTSSFTRVVAPYVAVASGAALALAGSHWTEFRLADGAVLKGVPDRSFDWNLDTSVVFADGATVTLDVDALELSDEPQVLIAGEGHVWTEADYARFTLSRADAELRIHAGALAVVKGSALRSPYTLCWHGGTNWNAATWTAANGTFPTNWSACTLNDLATVRLVATNATLAVDCAVRAGTLAVAVAADGSEDVTTVVAAEGGSLGVETIDLAEVEGRVRIDVDTGAAAVLGPTNAAAEAVLARGGTGVVTMRGGAVCLETPGDWTLAAGAQGTLTVRVAPTNRVVRLAHLADGFNYPEGGFDVRVTDAAGGTRTDCIVVKEGATLVLVPSVLDAGDVDFAALIENAVAGAPYSHWLVRGAVSGTVTLANLPTDLPDGVTLEAETSGTLGVRLIVRAPEVRLGSIGINFAGGRNGQTNLPEARVSDNADCSLLPHGAQGVIGTNWNDVAAANGDYTVRKVVLRDGTLETNATVGVRVTNVANPYTTGTTAGDRILYGYLDDGKSPVVELSGIPFKKYRVIAYRSTDDAGKSFDACRIGTSAANARACYGPTVKSETGGVTLWGTEDMGWGYARVRNRLEEGVNYIVSDVLTGGRAYLASRRDFGRGCLAAIQVVEVAGEPPVDPERPEESLVLRATVTGDANWSRLDWRDTNGVEVADADWSKVVAVTLSNAVAGAKVSFDRTEFGGRLTLCGGVTVETHDIPSFTLQAGSSGTIRHFHTTEPAAGTVLVKTAADYAGPAEDVTVVSSNRFGIASAVHASVGWKAGGYYVHVDDIDNPTYSLTFEGSTDTSISRVIGLSNGTSDSGYFEPSRNNGQALTGRDPYFSMTVPSVWTLNIVARMPNNENGILFGMGKGGAYAERGVGLASAGNDRAALVIWDRSGSRRLLVADVEFATRQFHSYALVSDGTNLSFFVDGVKVGTQPAAGYPSDGNCQFFNCHSARPSGIETGASGAIDDWRFYSGLALTPESIAGIAEEFAPWPECRTSVVRTPSQTMNDLRWDAGDALLPKVLVGAGGSLKLAGEYVCDVPLRTRGEALAIAFFENAQLKMEGGLVAGAPLTLDVSGMDVADLAKYAVTGLPYARWLVRGTVAGDVRVTGIPALPNGYSVRTEILADYGVRLVIKAPRVARFGSVGISVGGDDVAAVSEGLGLYPAAAGEWFAYGTWSTTPTEVGGLLVAGSAGGKIDPTSPWGTGSDVPRFFWHTSYDGEDASYDGTTNGLTVTGLSGFAAAYRVVVYLATDTGGAVFGPVSVNGRAYTAHIGAEADATLSLPDSTFASWGSRAKDAREGVNAVVSDVLTGDALSVFAKRQFSGLRARGQIAAVQIVRVGETVVTKAVDYSAAVTGDALWNGGAGSGLEPSRTWVNDPDSTITLTANVARATLTFDTPVTADVLRVIGETNRTLVFAAATPDIALATLDFTGAAGTVTLTDTLGAGLIRAGGDTRLLASARGTAACTVASGAKLTLGENLLFGMSGDLLAQDGTLRYLGARNSAALATYLPSAGIYEFERATVTGDLKAANVAQRKIVVRDGDDVSFDTQNGFGCTDLSVEITGGRLTYLDQTVWIAASAGYRQTGGIVTFGADANARTLIPGYTGNDTYVMNISGGTTDVSRMTVQFDRPSAIRISGNGVFKTKGFGGKSSPSHAVTLSEEAVLELGSEGWTAQTQPLTLAGGELRAGAASTMACAIDVTGSARLVAPPSGTLAINAGVTGSGTLACDAGTGTGAIVFRQGVASTVTLEGTFALWLTAAQTNAQEEIVLFRTGAAFDREHVTLCGPEGNVLPAEAGALVVRGGQAIWVSSAAFVPVEVGRAVVRVAKAWLSARKIDPAALVADPAFAGANGLPVAVSYALGLEPTNAVDGLRCTIARDAGGHVTLTLPNVDAARQPDPETIRYILQHKAAWAAEWADHSTNRQTTVSVAPDGAPVRFFRYLILLK